MRYTVDEAGIHYYDTEDDHPAPSAPMAGPDPEPRALPEMTPLALPEMTSKDMTLEEALVAIAKVAREVEAIG